MPETLPDHVSNFLLVAYPSQGSVEIGDETFNADDTGVFLGIAPGEQSDEDVAPAGRALNRLFELKDWQLDLFRESVRASDDSFVVVAYELKSNHAQPIDDEEHRTVFGLDRDDLEQWLDNES